MHFYKLIVWLGTSISTGYCNAKIKTCVTLTNDYIKIRGQRESQRDRETERQRERKREREIFKEKLQSKGGRKSVD